MLILTGTQNFPSVAKIVGPSGGLYSRLSTLTETFEELLTHKAQPRTKQHKSRSVLDSQNEFMFLTLT